ncbi:MULTISPECIES: c-type cytochrome [Mesobacillus]|uniref:Mono/diheme cytochrome c family protein n=1 Tax=Mesobacillus stamsii TaxID=225347 RepID=A0ABU0FSC4_9BACI|nr:MULTISPECIES: cytochrome c [Mesobacillus]MDQ0412806.1 mono/diheme cytochrome c family protein [Mesobacillus stamsii]
MKKENQQHDEDRKDEDLVSGIKIEHNKVPKLLVAVFYVVAIWAIGYAIFMPGKLEVEPEAAPQDNKGELIFTGTCLNCHATGAAPDLKGVTDRLKEEDIKNVIKNGRNTMPAIGHLYTDKEIDKVYEFLEDYR